MEQIKAVDRRLAIFREAQITLGVSARVLAKAKGEALNGLSQVEEMLNTDLAGDYGHTTEKRIETFIANHHPFHWYIEFYDIRSHGGFDVVIGNPPYVEYRKVQGEYTLCPGTYRTETCGNLLAFLTERGICLLGDSGRLGLVLLVSTFSTERMRPLQDVLAAQSSEIWISSFAWRPSKLFAGANTINSILIAEKNTQPTARLFSTNYIKWNGEERPHLFRLFEYGEVTNSRIPGCFPKYRLCVERSILSKILAHSPQLSRTFCGKRDDNILHYFRGMLYWIKVLDRLPIQREDGVDQVSGQCKRVRIVDTIPACSIIALMSSSLFFSYYQVFSDCQQINRREFDGFGFAPDPTIVRQLDALGNNLMDDYRCNARLVVRHNYSREVTIEKEYFTINRSKHILDAIDTDLAAHYGMTDEEREFIVNYDIKYHMGISGDDG